MKKQQRLTVDLEATVEFVDICYIYAVIHICFIGVKEAGDMHLHIVTYFFEIFCTIKLTLSNLLF